MKGKVFNCSVNFHYLPAKQQKSSRSTFNLVLDCVTFPHEPVHGDSVKETLRVSKKEETSSRTRLGAGGHLPQPVGLR